MPGAGWPGGAQLPASRFRVPGSGCQLARGVPVFRVPGGCESGFLKKSGTENCRCSVLRGLG